MLRGPGHAPLLTRGQDSSRRKKARFSIRLLRSFGARAGSSATAAGCWRPMHRLYRQGEWPMHNSECDFRYTALPATLALDRVTPYSKATTSNQALQPTVPRQESFHDANFHLQSAEKRRSRRWLNLFSLGPCACDCVPALSAVQPGSHQP